MKRYKIIYNESKSINCALYHTMEEVNQSIKDGWIPKGGIQIVNMNGSFIVAQAVSLI